MNRSIYREATELGEIIEIPVQFSDYICIRTINITQNSVILLVADSAGKHYAAKVMSRAWLCESGQTEDFNREIEILRLMRHPNIVRLYSVVELSDIIVTILEYCDGGDLFIRLWRTGSLPVPVCRSYLYQILKALEWLHMRGYAHRDIKPENIFVTEKIAKLGDFGIARAAGCDGLMSTICGSVPYVAPEVLAAVPYDGEKADIWSVGVLAFVMATFQLPWAADAGQDITDEIVGRTITFPVGFPVEMIPFINLCLQTRPTDRPTVRELLTLPWIRNEAPAYSRLIAAGGDAAVTGLNFGTVRQRSAKFMIAHQSKMGQSQKCRSPDAKADTTSPHRSSS
jgi:serine/threonine protein kinase